MYSFFSFLYIPSKIKPTDRPRNVRQYPVLVTENSTQSSEPLIERSSPQLQYPTEEERFPDQNFAFKSDSLEDNESTDDGGFKDRIENNATTNLINQMKEGITEVNPPQPGFYRFPQEDLVSVSDV